MAVVSTITWVRSTTFFLFNSLAYTQPWGLNPGPHICWQVLDPVLSPSPQELTPVMGKWRLNTEQWRKHSLHSPIHINHCITLLSSHATVSLPLRADVTVVPIHLTYNVCIQYFQPNCKCTRCSQDKYSDLFCFKWRLPVENGHHCMDLESSEIDHFLMWLQEII